MSQINIMSKRVRTVLQVLPSRSKVFDINFDPIRVQQENCMGSVSSAMIVVDVVRPVQIFVFRQVAFASVPECMGTVGGREAQRVGILT